MWTFYFYFGFLNEFLILIAEFVFASRNSSKMRNSSRTGNSSCMNPMNEEMPVLTVSRRRKSSVILLLANPRRFYTSKGWLPRRKS